MRLVLLFFLIPFFSYSQNYQDYWSWLDVMNNKDDSYIRTYFKLCSRDYGEDEKYGDLGFYFNLNDIDYIFGKNYNDHLLGNLPGNTLTLFVIRDNLKDIDIIADQLVNNYFLKGGSYLTTYDGPTKLSAGSYDSDLNKEGLQIDLDDLLEYIDFSSKSVNLNLMLFFPEDAKSHPTIKIKLSQEGYFGYNWLFQISGTEQQINSLLKKMPQSSSHIKCELEENHAFLSAILGTNTAMPVKGLFDTGASLVTIPRNIADELIKNGDAERNGFKQFSTANGTITSEVIIINSILIQGVLFRNIHASVGVTKDILLGQSLLEEFDWGYDNTSGRIILK